MKNLLKFELHKLFKQKSFYICTIIMLVLSFFSILLNKSLANNSELNMTMPTVMSSLLTAVNSSNFTMICGIFIALFVCTDYDQQTIKNVYSRGFSRSKVYFAKYIVCFFSTLIMFATMLIFTYGISKSTFDGGKETGNYVGLLSGQFFFCIAYSSFVFAVSLIIKKVGVSIALAILGPSLIGTVINLLDAFLKIDDFKINSYWLNSFISDLTSLATDNTRLIICTIFSILYAVAFIIIGYFISKKQEN